MGEFLSAVVIIVIVGFGAFAAGKDFDRRDTINGCVEANSHMPHKDVVPHCRDLVDTWNGLKKKENKE